MTAGVGNTRPVGGPRGVVNGWSPSAVRRHKRWLYSVVAPELTGHGYALTLTLRKTPGTHGLWQALVKKFLRYLRESGALRWHWVVEWQRRGTPHLHMAVYFAEPLPWLGHELISGWLDRTRDYGTRLDGQVVKAIDGPVGWLQYLSKHASRGVAHYQRQGKPPGWEKTGRLWGYGGAWPVEDPLAADVEMHVYWRLRRMVRGYAIAGARSEALRWSRTDAKKASAAWGRVAWLRRSLKTSDLAISRVRGVSEWVPQAVILEMLVCAGWTGELVASDVDGSDGGEDDGHGRDGGTGGLQAERAPRPHGPAVVVPSGNPD